jgi:glycosyltransferase involved in cell wall biosynthesis
MIKILICIHGELRNPISGADFYVIRLREWLLQNGCEVEWHSSHLQFEWADCIISNLAYGTAEAQMCEELAKNKPLFWIIHNSINPAPESSTVIYNSDSLRLNRQGLTVYPIPDNGKFEDHSDRKFITLINCCDNKGGETLFKLSQLLPHMNFLGVMGGYGGQIQQVSSYNNLSYRPFQTDMEQIWQQTKILIVPSKKESWSLVAAEAQIRGIPVVCSDLEGLREHLGDSARYCTDLSDYERAIHLNGGLMECVKSGIIRQELLSKVREQQLHQLLNHMKEKVKTQPVVKEKQITGPKGKKKDAGPNATKGKP